MTFSLGFKTDPVEYRYSYLWLWELLERLGVRFAQLGSSFEMYQLPDSYFLRLRREAEDHGVTIHSTFTAHRELGGLLLNDREMREVARTNYRRWIEIASLVGASSAGSNPGAVMRDQISHKRAAEDQYLEAMIPLAGYAAELGLECLTLESMSALAEPPTTKAEISRFMQTLNSRSGTPAGPGEADRKVDTSTSGRVPIYICADIAHGYASESGMVIESNEELFAHAVPWMWEFHIKNTDAIYNSTFGFSAQERERGIVDLAEFAGLVSSNAGRFPREAMVGYLELPGPKLGRDYSDHLLERQIKDSVNAIREFFEPALKTALRG
jgi:hypothetical protein